jgi:sulfatase modifying factor 1
MLETRFKVVFLLAVLFAASLPIIAILRGTISTPFEAEPQSADSESGRALAPLEPASPLRKPLPEELVVIPAGPFM